MFSYFFYTVNQPKENYATVNQTTTNNAGNQNQSTSNTGNQNQTNDSSSLIIGIVILVILALIFIILAVYGMRNTDHKVSFLCNYLLAFILPPLCVVLVFNDGAKDGATLSKTFHVIFNIVGSFTYVVG
ncbi:10876_t:CDS:2, partial [Scutellospora calospora]